MNSFKSLIAICSLSLVAVLGGCTNDKKVDDLATRSAAQEKNIDDLSKLIALQQKQIDDLRVSVMSQADLIATLRINAKSNSADVKRSASKTLSEEETQVLRRFVSECIWAVQKESPFSRQKFDAYVDVASQEVIDNGNRGGDSQAVYEFRKCVSEKGLPTLRVR